MKGNLKTEQNEFTATNNIKIKNNANLPLVF